MHDCMPYDAIQGQGHRHECLKATQEESTVSPARVWLCEEFQSSDNPNFAILHTP